MIYLSIWFSVSRIYKPNIYTAKNYYSLLFDAMSCTSASTSARVSGYFRIDLVVKIDISKLKYTNAQNDHGNNDKTQPYWIY